MNGTDKLKMVEALMQRLQNLKDDDMSFFDIIYKKDEKLATLIKSAYNMGATSAAAQCLSVIGRLCDEE